MKFNDVTTFRMTTPIKEEVRSFADELMPLQDETFTMWFESDLVHFTNETVAYMCEVAFHPNLVLVQRCLTRSRRP